MLIFPDSLHDQFLTRLKSVLQPLKAILADQEDLLATDPTTEDWAAYKRHKMQLAGASKALGMLGMSEKLLHRNVTFQRASAKDLQDLLVSLPHLAILVVLTASQRHVSELSPAVRADLPTFKILCSAVSIAYCRASPRLTMRTADVSPVPAGADEELVVHFGRSQPPTPHTSRPPSPGAEPSHPSEIHEQVEQSHTPHSHSNLFKHMFSHNYLHRPHSGSRAHSGVSSRDVSAPHSPHHHNGRVGFVESQAYMLIEHKMGREGDLSYLPDLMSSLRTSSLPILHQ